MITQPTLPDRKSLRLPGYDYSQAGAYFVTICTDRRRMIFGDVVDDHVVLSEAGLVIQEEWLRSAELRDEIEIDAFVVMPNHIHGVVFLKGPLLGTPTLSQPRGPTPRSLSSMIAGFKSAATKRVREHLGCSDLTVWQRGFHDRVIRDERELEAIRQYIADNPIKWALDPNHPSVAAGARR